MGKRSPEISNEDAADALRYGGKSGPVPTHPAMDDADPTDWTEEDWAAYYDEQGY
jgi:hypothetical protein